jgi:membrane fusion protein (multidrug efflux system)
MRRTWLAGAVALLCAAGAAYYFTLGGPPSGAPPTAGPGRGGPPGGFAVPVEAVAAKRGSLNRWIDAVGTLRSDESIVVRPEIAGRILKINFTEGTKVEKGTPLVELDNSIARAQLAQARASLALSRANVERAQSLFGREAMSARSRDEAIAKLKSDEAAVTLSEAMLEKMTLSAPFAGIVGLRKVSLGDFVAVGQDIASLEKISPIKVDFRVPEIYLASVSTGQSIEVHVDAYPDRTFRGAVYAIDPLVDERGRSIVIRARVPNEESLIRPGLFARVRLIVTERNDAILVPEEALVPFGAEKHVFRVVDGKAVDTAVKTGARREGVVHIVEGVAEGEMVVTAGQLKLRDGAPVMVLPPGGGPPGGGPPGGGPPGGPGAGRPGAGGQGGGAGPSANAPAGSAAAQTTSGGNR